MLNPETILQGRYRIIRQLGQGGMGAVYEAIDERLDTTVALKETLFADERLRKQFEREARMLARLHHPALPRVSDHFSEGEGQFLVMQYIAGEDLAEMVARRRGPFPADQVLTWANQLLDALDYLHTQEPPIVHRDIKPQNLKLTPRGQIILLDFGLAKGQAGEVSRVTTSASIFGFTPNYAPLEQIQGLGTDARSDIYALAATIYHLMTGIKPPDALSRAAAIVNGQPDPLRNADEANPSVDPAVAAVLQKAMSQNREQRYRTAVEMEKALASTDHATTVSNRAEAATVLFASPPTAATLPREVPLSTQVTGEPTVAKKRTQIAGETTVVRATGESRKQFSPLLIVAGIVALVGVCAAAFIAFRRPPVAGPPQALVATPASSPTASPSPEAAQNASDDSASANDEKAAAEQGEKAAAADKQAARATKSRNAEKRASASTKREEDVKDEEAGEHKSVTVPEPPDVPDKDMPNPPNSRPRVKRFPGGVVIRYFPDGSQLITTPDGGRVLISPNGKRRVYRPGDRGRPNPNP